MFIVYANEDSSSPLLEGYGIDDFPFRFRYTIEVSFPWSLAQSICLLFLPCSAGPYFICWSQNILSLHVCKGRN